MIKYEIDKENRRVTAIIEGSANDIVDRLRNRVGDIVQTEQVARAAKISNKFKGVAKCHPEDEFNEEEGKRIARHRLLDAYNNARIRAYARVDREIQKMDSKASERLMKEIERVVRIYRSHNSNT